MTEEDRGEAVFEGFEEVETFAGVDGGVVAGGVFVEFAYRTTM